MTYATTNKSQVGGEDFRFRIALTFVPSLDRRYKEIYCLYCSRKILETHDDLAYASDVGDMSNLSPGQPSAFGMSCKGGCHYWYEIKTVPGIFDIETTRMFFLDSRKKHREVHCPLCKELFCTITTGEVYGMKDPYTQLKTDNNGFVPTFCPGADCWHEYEITTSVA